MIDDISIYIHWPFCLSKCPYCDFNSHVTNIVDHEQWLKSYLQELDYFADNINKKYIRSIFFGGGTPSLMEPYVVAGIIDKVANLGNIDHRTEITLETNPTSFETEKFRSFASAGINRVSIGVQAMRDDDLRKLGRMHDINQAKNAIKMAGQIFPRISFDLIYARSGQSLQAWQKELKEAMELAQGHISLYQLVIEKATPFYKLFNDGNLILPDQDEAAIMYEWTKSYLQSYGYNRYEISNFALIGQESIHNLAYWHYRNYLGIGPGAHSRIHKSTKDNEIDINSMMMYHKPEKWLESIKTLGSGIQNIYQLSQQEMREEFVMMGLRLKCGITTEALEKLLHLKINDVINMQCAAFYKNLGLLNYSDHNIHLSDNGMLLHSYLVPRLLDLTQIID